MTEKEAPSFEILHFSVRYPKGVKQYPYFVHNLVWRALDPGFRSVCEGMTEEWRRTEVAFDTERAEEYLRGLDMSFEEIEGVDGRIQQPPVRVVEQREVSDDGDDGRTGRGGGPDGDAECGRDRPVDAGRPAVRMPGEVLTPWRVALEVTDRHR
jgi:hypothetical protein